jgi:hypothetical protein
MESLNLATNSKPTKGQDQHFIQDEDDDFHNSDGEGSAFESEEDQRFDDEDEGIDANVSEEEVEVEEKENQVPEDRALWERLGFSLPKEYSEFRVTPSMFKLTLTVGCGSLHCSRRQIEPTDYVGRALSPNNR